MDTEWLTDVSTHSSKSVAMKDIKILWSKKILPIRGLTKGHMNHEWTCWPSSCSIHISINMAEQISQSSYATVKI